jgi:hypothetical protein
VVVLTVFVDAGGGSLTTGGVVVTDLGCGASLVAVVFGLEMGVAEAVAGGAFSFCSLRDFFDFPESLFSLSLLLEEEVVVRGTMLFPFSAPGGELAACVGWAASMGEAETKSARAVVYKTFFMMHS